MWPAMQASGARSKREAVEPGPAPWCGCITVRKTIDGIIATACMEANLPLLLSDRDVLP